MTRLRRIVHMLKRRESARITGPTVTGGTRWPHVTSQDLYNIQMAFVRNHGFGAQRVERGVDLDPHLRITATTGEIATLSVSPDGTAWKLSGVDGFAEPLATGCADLADRVVDAMRASR